ncbi:MAG: hypothetical protein ACLTW9_09015 [Enterocloster sp.]
MIKLDCGFRTVLYRRQEEGREFSEAGSIQMTNKMGFTSLCEGIETAQELEDAAGRWDVRAGPGLLFFPAHSNECISLKNFAEKCIDKIINHPL